MVETGLSFRTFVTFSSLLISFFFLPSLEAIAGCGCDKPPPAPAAIIPNVAFPGMPVTLFHASFAVGQNWRIAFYGGATTITTTGTVIAKRDLTDVSGYSLEPQLVVAVPIVPPGPTQVVVSSETESFTVSAETFTVIGRPVAVAEQTGKYEAPNYVTGVGADGTLYMSVGGLANVCQAMKFKAIFPRYPLRFGLEDIIIFNAQGFMIDSLNATSVNRFSFVQERSPKSDRFIYYCHSFAQYCTAHQPGGSKEVDPLDTNWHRDGTPHVDYSTLIFAITGHLDNGVTPAPGATSFAVNMETILGDGVEPWENEQEEEGGGDVLH